MAQGANQVDVFTTAGKNFAASNMWGLYTGGYNMRYIAIGSGTAADANVADTGLGSELTGSGLARKDSSKSWSSNTVTFSATFTNNTGGAVTVTEAELVTADMAGSGTCLRHITFGSSNSVTLAVGSSLTVTISQTIQ